MPEIKIRIPNGYRASDGTIECFDDGHGYSMYVETAEGLYGTPYVPPVRPDGPAAARITIAQFADQSADPVSMTVEEFHDWWESTPKMKISNREAPQP